LDGLRVGLIGSGFIARQKHLQAWRKKIGKVAQVVVLCDPNVAETEELARVEWIPKVYKDFQQMLPAERFGAGDICSPSRIAYGVPVNITPFRRPFTCRWPRWFGSRPGKGNPGRRARTTTPHESLYARLKEGCREVTAQLNWDHLTGQMEDYYEGILGRNNGVD
jgi:GFO/IDH/MocA oxidoreductase family protein